MGRIKLKPEQRRQPLSFTTHGLNIKKLDNYILQESQKQPLSVISRQTILERLLIDFLSLH